MHSTMMGSQFHGECGPGSIMSGGSQYRKDGSMMSGRGSSFQRGEGMLFESLIQTESR